MIASNRDYPPTDRRPTAQVPDASSQIAKHLTHAIERGLGRCGGAYGLGQIEARLGEQLADLRQLVADGDQLAQDLSFDVVGYDDTVADQPVLQAFFRRAGT